MRPGRPAGALASSRLGAAMLPIDEPPPDAGLIGSRYAALLARLRAVAEASGRDADTIRVIAVTKGFPVAVVQAARRAGLTRFGENRVQEAIPKVAAASDAEWHLVGRLQANKARPAAHAFAVVHSVDSLDLLRRLDRIASEEALAPALLLQVNVSDEGSKAGFERTWFADQVRRPAELLSTVRGLAATRVMGLMTIAPAGAPSEEARSVFARLRALRDALQELAGRPFPELSMGMTSDAESAVAEGATLVRIGTGIFGPRPA
ncbi:MAG: YggS family pyridoxal phosphate-dependent enzyme [Chloroflexota bacterium]|nr:YggS family pyridoxal phosphate-dependent enzyme [Chloroflexota bacterium]